MLQALRGAPDQRLPMPNGLVSVRISPTTGELAGSDDPTAIFETFIEGHLPQPADTNPDNPKPHATDKDNKDDEPLF